MVFIPVLCPYCHSDRVSKRGKTDTGKQRYRCHNPACPHQSFLLILTYKGRLPEVKQQVLELSLNGSGVRDTARVLHISSTTVIHELKKRVSPHLRPHSTPENLAPGERSSQHHSGGSRRSR